VGGAGWSRSLAGDGVQTARTSSTSWCSRPDCLADPTVQAVQNRCARRAAEETPALLAPDVARAPPLERVGCCSVLTRRRPCWMCAPLCTCSFVNRRQSCMWNSALVAMSLIGFRLSRACPCATRSTCSCSGETRTHSRARTQIRTHAHAHARCGQICISRSPSTVACENARICLAFRKASRVVPAGRLSRWPAQLARAPLSAQIRAWPVLPQAPRPEQPARVRVGAAALHLLYVRATRCAPRCADGCFARDELSRTLSACAGRRPIDTLPCLRSCADCLTD
jgi:hypothetical protein